jgi:hypothetical protein
MDSGRMYLERDGVVLREMDVVVGGERYVNVGSDSVQLPSPRGARTVTRLYTARDAWLAPTWVFSDRALEVPERRAVVGGLGAFAIALNGGAVIYARPARGPLADSTYVMPGSVLARADDLRAIAPNVTRGMTVYFY